MKKNELLALAFLEGGLVMLLETSSPLIVAPILGHSVVIWATMICLSIGALAIGYFLGGFLSKKKRDESFVIKLFSMNVLILLAGWLMLYLQNYSGADFGTSSFTWTIVFVVLVIPLILFGASTPLIVAILHEKFGDNKEIVGKLYSVSTLGGVIFSLLAGYWFIPEIGISDSILVGVILTSLLPIRYFLRHKNLKFLVPIGGIAIISIFLTQVKAELPKSSKFTELYFSESINGQLIVADFEKDGRDNRILFINRMGQTWIDLENDNSMWPYVNVVTCISKIYPQNSNSLVLGLGGGILPKQLSTFCGHSVDAVEIDQRIIDISEEYFGLKGSGVRSYMDDARRFVKNSEKRYDFVVMDIFNGEILPSHGLSKEAFEDIKSTLRPKGMIVINFNGFLKGKEGLPGRSLIKTLKAAGFKLKLLDADMGKSKEKDRNMLYLAYLNEPDWTKALPLNFGEEEFLISEQLIDPKTINTKDALLITDDKPIMEFINRHAAKSWRESYLENFTLKFKEEYKLPFVK
ncbi:MAG: putative membrane-bound spermidine synthase [Flavobacteriaceae bacterium]|jgi:predicted membrane-bound spermidine synthase